MAEGLHIDITGDNSGFINALNGAREGVRATQRQVEESGGSIEKMFSQMKTAAAGVFAGFSAKQLISEIVNVRGQFQQLEMAFTTMLGSADKAKSLMAEMTDFAAKTPFDLQGVADGARQLLAYGVSANKVTDTLRRLGDIAAGLSIPLSDIVYLYGTTLTQGRMYTQDLRQFTGRGIPMMEELAKQFGVTKDKVGELVTEGKVGSAQMVKAIKSMTDEGGKFGGLMDAQSKTITGQISNIEDSLKSMFNQIGESNEGIINDAIGGVSKLVENYETVGKVIAGVAATYGVYKTAVMVATAIQNVHTAAVALGSTTEAVHYGWLVVTEKAQALLNATMLKNPYVLVATALAALVAGLIATKSSVSDLEAVQNMMNDTNKEAAEAQKQYNQETENAVSVASNEAASTDDRRKAMNLLIARYPSIIKKYIDEEGHLKNILQFKQAIAAVDGQRTVQEHLKASQQYTNISKTLHLNAQKHISGQEISAKDQAIEDNAIAQYAKYNNLSEWRVRAFTHISTIMKWYDNAAAKERRQAGRVNTQNHVNSFSDTIGTMSNERLNRLRKTLDNAKKTGKNVRLQYKELQGAVLNQNDIDNLIVKVSGIQNSRKKATTYAQDAKTARAAWDKANKEYARLQKSKAATTKQVQKAREAVDAASKNYKDITGTTPEKENAASAKAGKASAVAAIKDQKNQLELAKDKESYVETVDSTSKEEQRQLVDMEYETRQAVLDARKESFSKEMEQAQLDYEKEKTSIERWYEDLKDAKIKKAKQLFEANPNNKNSVFNSASVDTSYTKEETAAYEARMKAAQDKRDNKTGDITERRNEAEAQSIQDYLKKYGTMEQKRVALTQEAEAKIKKVRENGELTDKDKEYQVKSIQAGLQKALGELDLEDLKKSINWEYVFGDLDNVDIDTIKAVKDQLQQIVDTCKDMAPDQIKTVTDALGNLQTKIDLSKPIATIKEARKEYKAALQEFNAAKSKRDTAKSTGDTKGEKEATTQMVTASQKMTKAKNKEKKSFDSVTKTVDEYAQALNEAGNAVGGTTGEVMKLAASAITCGTSMVQGFKAVKEAASNLERAVAILAVIQAAMQAIQLIMQVFGDSEDTTLTDYVDTMKVYIDLLNDSINDLNKSMTSAENTMQDTIKYYRELVSLEKESATAIKSQSQVWLNSGASKGFLGIGSKSSEGRRISKQIADDLKSGNEEVRKFYEEGYASLNEYFRKVNGYAAQSASDFGRMDFIWKLSDDNLMKLSQDTKAMALLGDTLSQAVSDYAAKIKEAKDAQDSMFESLLSVSWDDFREGFTDAIKDMDKTGKDFANDFAEYMRNALVKNMVAEKYKGKLEELYKKAGVYAEDGDLQSHIDELRNEYQNLAESAHKEVETIDKITGYTESSSSQSGSSGSWQSMGEDTAEELNGRFTALQESGEEIKEGVTSMVDTLGQLSGKADEGNLTLSEIRNLMVMNNSYLEDILAVNKKYYDSFGKQLTKIERASR